MPITLQDHYLYFVSKQVINMYAKTKMAWNEAIKLSELSLISSSIGK